MVKVALRPSPDGFAAADHCTVPEPVPEEPEVMVNHDWLLFTVHWRAVAAVVTVTDPVPPAAGTLAEVGLIVNTPPDWVIVIVIIGPRDGFPVSVAVRDVASGFGAAV